MVSRGSSHSIITEVFALWRSRDLVFYGISVCYKLICGSSRFREILQKVLKTDGAEGLLLQLGPEFRITGCPIRYYILMRWFWRDTCGVVKTLVK